MMDSVQFMETHAVREKQRLRSLTKSSRDRFATAEEHVPPDDDDSALYHVRSHGQCADCYCGHNPPCPPCECSFHNPF